MRSRDIEWLDQPTMNPRNTKQLRALIERPTVEYLWGQKHIVIPRVCSTIFGDGRQLFCLYPIMYRPNYFVVRIDSSWSLEKWDDGKKKPVFDWLDDVYDVIEEEFYEWPWAKEYGMDLDGDEARVSFCDGSTWGSMKWPRLKRKKRKAVPA